MGKIAEIEKILMETDSAVQIAKQKVHTKVSILSYEHLVLIEVRNIKTEAYNKIHKILMEDE